MRRRAPSAARLAVTLAVASLCACGAPLRRFPVAAPVWTDPDTEPLAERPAPYATSDVWDEVDQSLFRAAETSLAFEPAREAVNVNALDEVPDSSWFQNRLGRELTTPEDVARGACTTGPPDDSPLARWVVTEAKPNGYNPGFVARAPDGRTFLLKADGLDQPEVPTTADVVGSRLYFAAGFYTPCNRIVRLARESLLLDPGAPAREAGAAHRVLTAAVMDRVLSLATRGADGRYRFAASEYVEGDPLGPFTYQGVRPDDPNDAVPHEDRRELRGARLLAAWLNHYDSREQNTLTTWIDLGPRGGYVRHWFIDFGDSLGSLWPFDGLSRRSGYAYLFDPGVWAEDFFTLGLWRRPWDAVQTHPGAEPFGYFGAEHFDPEGWRPIAPNQAFLHLTERDAAWMARRIARLSPEHVRAAVREARLDSPALARYLADTLLARRQRLLARYLTRLSPLADPGPAGDTLCATDLAVRAGVLPARAYRAVRYAGPRLARLDEPAATAEPGGRVCVDLARHHAGAPRATAPDGAPAPAEPTRYAVLDLGPRAGRDAPLRVHLYDLGPGGGYRVLGVERPPGDAPPRP